MQALSRYRVRFLSCQIPFRRCKIPIPPFHKPLLEKEVRQKSLSPVLAGGVASTQLNSPKLQTTSNGHHASCHTYMAEPVLLQASKQTYSLVSHPLETNMLLSSHFSAGFHTKLSEPYITISRATTAGHTGLGGCQAQHTPVLPPLMRRPHSPPSPERCDQDPGRREQPCQICSWCTPHCASAAPLLSV